MSVRFSVHEEDEQEEEEAEAGRGSRRREGMCEESVRGGGNMN